MPIDPNDILAVAILLSKQNTEATDRSAVSRAYYCVYHFGMRVIEEKLPPVDPEKPSKGCHQQLNDRLREGKKSKWEKVAYKINSLRKARVIADYHLEAPASAIDAHIAIQRARTALKALDAL
jgi:hypothetical protein